MMKAKKNNRKRRRRRAKLVFKKNGILNGKANFSRGIKTTNWIRYF